MGKDFRRSEGVDYFWALAQVELLEALLEPNDAFYPWNTANPESEAYFEEREWELVLEDWSESEMTALSQTFFIQLAQMMELAR